MEMIVWYIYRHILNPALLIPVEQSFCADTLHIFNTLQVHREQLYLQIHKEIPASTGWGARLGSKYFHIMSNAGQTQAHWLQREN